MSSFVPREKERERRMSIGGVSLGPSGLDSLPYLLCLKWREKAISVTPQRDFRLPRRVGYLFAVFLPALMEVVYKALGGGPG